MKERTHPTLITLPNLATKCIVLLAAFLLGFSQRCAQADAYLRHNLVSDLAGLADLTDTNLANPWGIAFSPTSPFWISDNHTGLSTLYNSTGALQSLIVTIPPPAGASGPAAPTGIVFNNTSNFVVGTAPARFIFATEDGTISAWNSGSGSNALLKVDHSASEAIYKGLALASANSTDYLYAANFHAGTVEIFDGNFAPVSLSNAFQDPQIPAGFAPFGLATLGGNLYVTYAKQDADKKDDISGAGNGFVDVYDPSGKLLQRLIAGGPLNSPWGLTVAPAAFGQFSNALLVGNFGDGKINAFNPITGAWLGTLEDGNGQPIVTEGLWALTFGNGGSGGDSNTLYFTAGISGGASLEDHGLFGAISARLAIRFTHVIPSGNSLTLTWEGGKPPYHVQMKRTLNDPQWVEVTSSTETSVTVIMENPSSFFRISD